MPPTLHTARLTLSPHTEQDFEDLAALWATEDVTRPIGRPPSTRQESWMRLLHYAGLWPLLGYGYWAVRDSQTNRYRGEVGFARFHRAIHHLPEAGWAFLPTAQNQGYATESLQAALTWLDPTHPTTICRIPNSNPRSLHLATKLGYRPTETPNLYLRA